MEQTAGPEHPLVGNRVYSGVFELVFATTNASVLQRQLEPLLDAEPAFQVSLQTASGWDYFEEHLLPSPFERWQIYNRRRLLDAQEQGIQQGSAQRIRYELEGPSHHLITLAQGIRPQGFELTVATESLLYADKSHPFNEEHLDAHCRFLEAAASHTGVRFLGWELLS
jgi:hypothetical protein